MQQGFIKFPKLKRKQAVNKKLRKYALKKVH